MLFIAVPVHAQQERGKWEVEFHAGGGPSSNPTDGTASLPAAGAPFTTVVGTPSRRTSSWFFGDGTVLLNQVNAALGLASRITPLDQVFVRSLLDREQGATFGVRVSRAISPRFSAEFALDYASSRLTINGPALAGIEAARASFVPAWTDLIASGPFAGSTITSVSTIHDGEKRQTFTTTGVLNINLRTSGKTIPYLSVGGGVVGNTGQTPSASLEGNYRFQAMGSYPMNETDAVTLRTSVDEGVVGVFGGGFKHLLSSRVGIRFDLRGSVGRVSTDTLLTTSSRVSSAPPGFVTASLSTPSVQFSNNPVLGASSLTGPAVVDFRSFHGSGLQTRMNATAGVFLRF